MSGGWKPDERPTTVRVVCASLPPASRCPRAAGSGTAHTTSRNRLGPAPARRRTATAGTARAARDSGANCRRFSTSPARSGCWAGAGWPARARAAGANRRFASRPGSSDGAGSFQRQNSPGDPRAVPHPKPAPTGHTRFPVNRGSKSDFPEIARPWPVGTHPHRKGLYPRKTPRQTGLDIHRIPRAYRDRSPLRQRSAGQIANDWPRAS